MSEIRRDPLTNAWIIVAPVRNARPEELVEMQLPLNYVVPCPFCAGNEDATPASTLIYSHTDCGAVKSEPASKPYANGTPEGWMVRVVPNKYPAVEARADAGSPTTPHPLFKSLPLAGGHEVIIESPVHVQSLTEINAAHTVAVFRSYADRLRYWYAQPHVNYAVVFKNVGAAAGASLRHLHSQLLATSELPPDVADTDRRLKDHHVATGHCMVCEMIDEELRQSKRIVVKSDRFVAYCPYASYLPYLIRVAPREHQSAFQDLPVADLGEVALLVRRMIGLLETAYSTVAYNFVIHTRAAENGRNQAFHWWIDLFPRITKIAGFEWGSGGLINPVAPEKAAGQLRSLDRMRRTSGAEGVAAQ